MTRGYLHLGRARGAVLIHCLVMLTVLIGMASLGADYGRVQLAKLELERCAVSAARAAASRVPNDFSAARDLAVAYGQFNTADGSPIAIDRNADVEFGIWNSTNRTFTPVSGGNLSSANAVRVTARRTGTNAVPLAFAALLGKSSANVRASSVALAGTQPSPAAFVGLEQMSIGNNFYGASYNSNSGPPGGSNVSSNFGIGSNGSMSFGNHADIYGDVVGGPGGSVSHGNGWFVSGSQTQQSTPFSYPPTEATGVGSSGALSRGNNSTVTLSAGTYLYSSITFGNGGTLATTGPVTIYVSGATQLGNNFTFAPHNGIPSNLRIRVIGSASVQLGNNLGGAAEIYGPGSAVQIGNNATFGGQVVGRQMQIGNNGILYRDVGPSAGGAGGSGIVTVQ